MNEAECTKNKKELSLSEKEKEETSRLNLFEILLRLANRLKEEIFILAVIFVILVAIIIVFAKEFPPWSAITVIMIYLIAALCYIVPKTIKERKLKMSLLTLYHSGSRCLDLRLFKTLTKFYGRSLP